MGRLSGWSRRRFNNYVCVAASSRLPMFLAGEVNGLICNSGESLEGDLYTALKFSGVVASGSLSNLTEGG